MIVVVIDSGTSRRPDLMWTPLQKPDFLFYTNGSCRRPSDSFFRRCQESGALHHSTSAQAAELYALTRACTIAKDKVTTYTDSRYVFGAVHDFGFFFLTSCGKPIKYQQLIRDWLDAILMPKRMAFVKCEERNILSLPRDEV